MSRVNKFEEGHNYPRESYDIPKKKRKNNKKGKRINFRDLKNGRRSS